MYYHYHQGNVDRDQAIMVNGGGGGPHPQLLGGVPPHQAHYPYSHYHPDQMKYGTFSHRTHHHAHHAHIPFSQRLMCEHHPVHHPHMGGLARVHSFTTRVYVNREPTSLVHTPSIRLSRYPSRVPSSHRSRPPSFAHRYHSAERPVKRPRNEDLTKYRTLPSKPKRWPSSERPSKRLKTCENYNSNPVFESDTSVMLIPHHLHHPQIQSVKKVNRSGSYSSLPSQKSQKVVKNASFHLTSPFRSFSPGTTVNSSYSSNLVKRENSLTSKLQNQSMGIHKLIFDRLNNNQSAKCQHCHTTAADNIANTNADTSSIPCSHVKYRLLSLEEQRKLVKFRRFLSAAHIRHKTDFLSKIEAIRRRQKREARQSIVDEHGIPASYYTQSR